MKTHQINKLIILAGMFGWLNAEADDIDMHQSLNDSDFKAPLEGQNSDSLLPSDSAILSYRNAEFGYFELIEEAESILIQWQTLFENSTSHFTIERSLNISEWESVGNVSGSGISYHEMSYEFKDIDPIQGISYYRIKETDVNGNVTYSIIKAVDFTGISKIQVFPQPACNELNLNLSALGGAETVIFLHTFRGKLVNEWSTNSSHIKLNLESLEKGLYLIRIQTSDYHETQKIIKN